MEKLKSQNCTLNSTITLVWIDFIPHLVSVLHEAQWDHLTRQIMSPFLLKIHLSWTKLFCNAEVQFAVQFSGKKARGFLSMRSVHCLPLFLLFGLIPGIEIRFSHNAIILHYVICETHTVNPNMRLLHTVENEPLKWACKGWSFMLLLTHSAFLAWDRDSNSYWV